MPSEETIEKIQQSSIWKMENEFYEFALDQFHFQKRLTFRLVDTLDNRGAVSVIEEQKTYLFSDGQLYMPKGLQFHYEKIRPR